MPYVGLGLLLGKKCSAQTDGTFPFIRISTSSSVVRVLVGGWAVFCVLCGDGECGCVCVRVCNGSGFYVAPLLFKFTIKDGTVADDGSGEALRVWLGWAPGRGCARRVAVPHCDRM